MKLFLQLLAKVLNVLPKTGWKPIPLCDVYGRYGLESPNLVGHNTAPSVTTDATPSSITTTSAVFDTNNISNTGGVNPTVRGICYVSGAGGTPTTADTVVSESGSFSTGNYSATMTGLSASTTYSVRAFATNTEGTGYGSVVEVTTLTGIPTVTTGNDGSVTSTTATISTNNVSATNGGTINSYGIVWNTTGTPTISDNKVETGTSFTTGNYNTNLTGLPVGTLVYFRAYATTTQGTGYGSTDSFTTDSNTPPTVALNSPSDTVATYYFDGSDAAASDPNNVWTDETNADDGSIATSATTSTVGSTSSNYIKIEGTNASGTGTISQVRARLYSSGGGSPDTGVITVVYTDSLTQSLGTVVGVNGSASYSSYTTLSVPTGGWTWDILQALEVKSYNQSGASNALHLIEIEVTSIYETADDTPTLSFTGTDAQSDDVRYNVQVTSVVDSYNDGSSIEVLGVDEGVGAIGQTFTGNGGYINSASFYLADYNENGIELVAKLYAITGTYGTDGKPTGSPLATSQTFDASLLTGSPAWTNFVFDTPYLTTNGTYYAVIIEQTAGTGAIWYYINDASPSHDGNFCYYTSNWNASAIYDVLFSVGYLLLDVVSGTDSGFSGSPDNTDPFASGQQVDYTVQSALSAGMYHWRVRGIDPSGTNTYGAWSSTRSFTITSGGGAPRRILVIS